MIFKLIIVARSPGKNGLLDRQKTLRSPQTALIAIPSHVYLGDPTHVRFFIQGARLKPISAVASRAILAAGAATPNKNK